jgi:hypothetical protein
MSVDNQQAGDRNLHNYQCENFQILLHYLVYLCNSHCVDDITNCIPHYRFYTIYNFDVSN